jgi:hypothetical protein
VSGADKPARRDPWAPPRAALELRPSSRQSPRQELPQNADDAKGALRAMLFAPALVIGPLAVLFMLFAGGWWTVVAAVTAYFGYRLYRR